MRGGGVWGKNFSQVWGNAKGWGEPSHKALVKKNCASPSRRKRGAEICGADKKHQKLIKSGQSSDRKDLSQKVRRRG